MPGLLDWFGWCIWDAFYHDVNAEGIIEGLVSLSKGGTPARFLIIDDGWQDTANEFQKEDEPFVEGSQFGGRLVSIRENKKFRKISNDALGKVPTNLKEFISDIKKTFGLKYVYVWHALMGYWGGLHPGAPETQKYNPTLKFPVQSPGNLAHISSKKSAITRASDDYYPGNPNSQTLHIAAVAYNSIFFGEVVVPDWDMFYSQHNAAEFHAIARAVGGCRVYVRI